MKTPFEIAEFALSGERLNYDTEEAHEADVQALGALIEANEKELRSENAALKLKVAKLEELVKHFGRADMVNGMMIVQATGHFGVCEWFRGGECTCGGGGEDVDYTEEIKKYGTPLVKLTKADVAYINEVVDESGE